MLVVANILYYFVSMARMTQQYYAHVFAQYRIDPMRLMLIKQMNDMLKSAPVEEVMVGGVVLYTKLKYPLDTYFSKLNARYTKYINSRYSELFSNFEIRQAELFLKNTQSSLV